MQQYYCERFQCRLISWSNTIRYLGINIVAGHKFACSLDKCKRSFYRAFNAIFGKVGRIASEDVIIELKLAKCLPALYYGLEACPVNKSRIRSLEYVLNNTFRKIFAKNHSMSQLTVYYILAVQFRTHSVGEKVNFTEAKVQNYQ